MEEHVAEIATGQDAQGHIVPYRTLIKVWAALLALTCLLVFLASLHHADLGLWATLLITPLKTGLVLYFFMHLKYESNVLKGMLFTALAALVVFLGMLFFDILLR